nr:hypothetical protein [Capnocytophaga leadbetteri]
MAKQLLLLKKPIWKTPSVMENLNKTLLFQHAMCKLSTIQKENK